MTTDKRESNRKTWDTLHARYADWPCRPGWVIYGAPSWWFAGIRSMQITRRTEGLFVSVRRGRMVLESAGWTETPAGLLAAQEWAETTWVKLAELAPIEMSKTTDHKKENPPPP